jgi:hypothetical protein
MQPQKFPDFVFYSGTNVGAGSPWYWGEAFKDIIYVGEIFEKKATSG